MSICLCVCACVCLSSSLWPNGWTYQHGIKWGIKWSITLDNSSTLQHYQDNPFPFLFHMGHPDKITFWAIISKLWTDSHQTWTACSLTRGTAYILRSFRSIDRSRFYDHFSDHRSAPKNQVHCIFIKFACNLQNLLCNIFILRIRNIIQFCALELDQ